MGALGDFLARHPRLWAWGRWLLEFGFHGEFRIIREALGELCGPAWVLEVGCGTGQMAPPFAGHRYVGIDVDFRFVSRALRGQGTSYAVMDARELAVASETVDMVLVAGVLHHLRAEDLPKVFREICRVLRPGGLSVIMEDKPVGFLEDPPAWLIHLWDLGGKYWTIDEYLAAAPQGLQVVKTGTMRSGLCPYLVMVLKKIGGHA